jgi:2-desacetyl-2-hydroxyethyl bacteriochlorophyllide A dehydrogenase
MKTEAIWYLGERSIELREMDIPDPGPNDVAVAMEACGICGWDVLAFSGRFAKFHAYPFCAGHEGIGRIAQVGEKVRSLKKGQRVALQELPIGTTGGPLMARHAIRADSQVAVIPESATPTHLWIVEPAVCIVNGIVYSGIQPGDSVALIGAGYMGLLFVQGLVRCLPGSVTVFDINDKRLELARELGATETVNTKGPLPTALERHFDVVIETAGTPESLRTALGIVRAGGIVQNFAWNHHEISFDLDTWHTNGLRIMNIQPGMNPHFFDLYPRTITLMANGTISNARLVTHTEKVERAKDLYTIAADRTGGYLKGVITF